MVFAFTGCAKQTFAIQTTMVLRDLSAFKECSMDISKHDEKIVPNLVNAKAAQDITRNVKKRISIKTIVKLISRILKRIKGFFPVTWAGLIFVCLAYVVWFGEVVRHQNQILFASVICLVAAFLLVFVFELIGVALVWIVTAHRNKDLSELGKLETNQVLDSGFQVFNPFWLPFVQVAVESEDAPFDSTFSPDGQWLKERIVIRSRGRYEKTRHLITVRDIFGVTSFTFPLKTQFNAEIKPSSCVFDSIQVSAHASGEGYSFPTGESKGELVEMRRYQAGDPLRYLLWRVFARSRKLLVRAPEPAIVEEHEMFIYFVAGQDDEPSASLTRTFLTSLEGSLAELNFCADGAKRISTDSIDALDDIIESVRHRSQGGTGISEQINKIPSSALRHFFMMVPSTSGVWLKNVAAFCGSSGIRPTFVMALEPTEMNPQKHSLIKRVFCQNEKELNQYAEREKLCDALSVIGSVRLVDVKTGDSMMYEPSAAAKKASAKRLPAGGLA